MNEKLIDEIVDEIVQSKIAGHTEYAKDGDPRWICIWQGTASGYSIKYNLNDYEWAEIVRRCKAHGIGIC